MSSTYKLLCLNHEPALVIDGRDWQSPEPAIAAALDPAIHDWLVEDHGSCELLVGRFSYPLVEICCPGGRHHVVGDGDGYHGSNPKWLRAEWARLLLALDVEKPTGPLIAQALRPGVFHRGCWGPQRLKRLAPHLGVELGG